MIGGILFKGGYLSPKLTFIFWMRRWLRTIPAYWTVLIVLLITAGHFTNPRIYSYFFFAQNIFATPQELNLFFGVAWSLAIEEVFYITLPLIILFNSYFIHIRARAILVSCLFLMLIPPLFRYFFYLELDWWQIRKLIFPRLDALSYGVIVAYCKYFHVNIYNKLTSKCFLFFWFPGVVIFFYILFIDPSLLQSAPMKVFGFCIIPFFTAIAIPSIADINISGTHNQGTKFVTKISILSYSIYLVHWDLELIIQKTVLKLDSMNSNLLTGDLFSGAIFIVCTTFLALFLYAYIEKPFLLLRNKYFY